jgi:hypothetical protein
MAVAMRAKRKWGQAIENKQVCEMAYFVPLMISTTYDQRRETARFARRKNPCAFAGFSASSRPKTHGSEINGGFGARAVGTLRESATRRRKLLESLKTDSQMAPPAPVARRENRSGELRMRRFAHNLRRESIFFIFLLVTL